MSSSSTSHQPEDSREFELMREVYLQGAPVWPTQDWVSAEMVNYVSADTRRFSSNWRNFYVKTTRKAKALRKKILSDHQKKQATDPAPIRLYLQPLGPSRASWVPEQWPSSGDVTCLVGFAVSAGLYAVLRRAGRACV